MIIQRKIRDKKNYKNKVQESGSELVEHEDDAPLMLSHRLPVPPTRPDFDHFMFFFLFLFSFQPLFDNVTVKSSW